MSEAKPSEQSMLVPPERQEQVLDRLREKGATILSVSEPARMALTRYPHGLRNEGQKVEAILVRIVYCPKQQSERRRAFFSVMRRPEMRVLRKALQHLRWDKDIDWRDIREIEIADNNDWMMVTDRFVVVCLCPDSPDLDIYDFSTYWLHVDREDCPCGYCEAALADDREAIAPGDYRYYTSW